MTHDHRHRTGGLRSVVIAGAALLPTAPALACSLCGSDGAVAIRARLIEAGPLMTAGALLLPIALLLLVVALVAREPSRP